MIVLGISPLDKDATVTLMVDGRIVYEDGRITSVDEAALRAEMRELMCGYREQLERAGHEARRLEPYYRAMLERAAAQDVGMNRWGPGG